MRLSVFAGVMLLASAAQAQTTTCDHYGSQTTCRTQLAPMFAPHGQRRQSDPNEPGLGDIIRARRESDLRKRIGGMLVERRCEEAKAAALQAGRFDLAQAAESLCRLREPVPEK